MRRQLLGDASTRSGKRTVPRTIATRAAVEKASSLGWERYTGFHGANLGLHTFGMSAPLKAVARHFGFEPARVVAAARHKLRVILRSRHAA